VGYGDDLADEAQPDAEKREPFYRGPVVTKHGRKDHKAKMNPKTLNRFL
jgi:hypothetical protein